MTEDHDFDAALEEASDLLDRHPDLGAAGEARLDELLETISQHEAAIAAEANPFRDRLAALNSRLEAIERDRADRRSGPEGHWPVQGVVPG